MIESLFTDPNYVAAKKWLDATALRQEAIASNIANLETPGYRRLDLNPSFEVELQRACGAGMSGEIAALKPSLAIDSQAASESKDGNGVQLEREMFELQQNTLAHTLQAQLVSGALSDLRLAITGKPS